MKTPKKVVTVDLVNLTTADLSNVKLYEPPAGYVLGIGLSARSALYDAVDKLRDNGKDIRGLTSSRLFLDLAADMGPTVPDEVRSSQTTFVLALLKYAEAVGYLQEPAAA